MLTRTKLYSEIRKLYSGFSAREVSEMLLHAQVDDKLVEQYVRNLQRTAPEMDFPTDYCVIGGVLYVRALTPEEIAPHLSDGEVLFACHSEARTANLQIRALVARCGIRGAVRRVEEKLGVTPWMVIVPEGTPVEELKRQYPELVNFDE